MRKFCSALLIFSINAWILGCGAHDTHHNDPIFQLDRDTDANSAESSTPAASLPIIPTSSEYMDIEPVSNGKVFIYEAGKDHSESIVLIHGAGNEGALIWSDIIPELAKRYHVVTFDLPGFGRSSRQNVLYSPLFYAKFVKWVVDRYVLKRPLIAMGHSLGGAVALCYAAIYPDNLQRLILIDVSGVIHRTALSQHIMASIPEKHKGWWNFPLKLFGVTMKNAVVAAEVPELSDNIDTVLNSPDLRDMVLKGDSQRIAGLALANFDFSNLIYRIKAPAVIIWGEHDLTTPVRTGKLLAHTLQHTQLKIIPETGHNIIRERPECFNQLIEDALVTTSWQRQWKPPQKTSRRAQLSKKQNITLTGYYTDIDIRHCANVLIKDVETEYIKVISSDKVVIENSRIDGKEFALNTRGSRIVLTGVHLTADTAIITSGSILDLAGVKLTGHKAAVQAINGSELLFSISRINSPFNQGYIHGLYEVIRKNPL